MMSLRSGVKDFARFEEEFVRQAKGCRSDRALCHVFEAATRELGFDHFALIRRIVVQGPRSKFDSLNTYPEAWAEEFVGRRLYLDDPVIRAAQRIAIGFPWSGVTRILSLTRAHRRVMALSARYGMGEGFTIPANVPGEPNASLSFAMRPGRPLPKLRLYCVERIGMQALHVARRLGGYPPNLGRPPDGGCIFVAGAGLDCAAAPILWSRTRDPDVLTLIAQPVPAGETGFDLAAFGGRAAIVTTGRAEHVVLRHDEGMLRLDIVAGSLCDGPARLFCRLADRAALDASLPRLRQLAAFIACGPGAPWIVPADPRLERLILALRTLDARHQGVSLRELARGLEGLGPGAIDWPGPGESTKSWARRLVAQAEALWRAGPTGVLARSI